MRGDHKRVPAGGFYYCVGDLTVRSTFGVMWGCIGSLIRGLLDSAQGSFDCSSYFTGFNSYQYYGIKFPNTAIDVLFFVSLCVLYSCFICLLMCLHASGVSISTNILVPYS